MKLPENLDKFSYAFLFHLVSYLQEEDHIANLDIKWIEVQIKCALKILTEGPEYCDVVFIATVSVIIV